MYARRGTPSAAELAALGLTQEDLAQDEDDVLVWPCNWPAVQLMSALATQWRIGMGGATGLDYGALPAVFELTGVPHEERKARFEELRIMERAALEAMTGSKN